jgi:hypothetical protein
MPPRPKNPGPPPKPKGMRVNTWCAINEVSRTHAYKLMKEGKLAYYCLDDRPRNRRILVDQPDPEN